MIGGIERRHYGQILRINQEFVHWLSPLDKIELEHILEIATYKRQIDEGRGVLIGYPHDADYPDHKNIAWLSQSLDNFFYIDRIIIDVAAQGQGYGRQLYADVEHHARERGYSALACEVNTKPNNPGSHAFHTRLGFEAIGDEDYPDYDATLRYYKKRL